MSLQQQPQDSAPLVDENRFLHLKTIDVSFAYNRLVSELKIKLKDEFGSKYKSDVFKKTDSLHWECDIYVKSLTTAILTVQKPFTSHPWHRLVAEFRLAFNSAEFGDDKIVERTDQMSGVIVKLSFGESKQGLDVTRLLADKAVSALATKVAMLDKLDQVLTYLNLALKYGSDVAQLHPAAQSAIPIVTAVFKKFQEIPSCHRELIFLMDDLVSLLPLMRLALDRATDAEVQGLLQSFLDLVKNLSQELIEYSSRSLPNFLFRNWLKSKTDDVNKLKNQVLQLKLNMGLGLDVSIQGGVLAIQTGVSEVREDVEGSRRTITEIRQHQLSDADEKALERLKPPTYSSYDPSRCCLPGTRASLLHDIEQWAATEDQSTRLYWIYGVAGCGKSSVAASVACHLESRKLLCGSFFCKRDIPERRDPIRLIRGLAYFLATACQPFSVALLRVLNEDHIILDKPFATQFNALLAGPLSEISQSASLPPVFVVVDALDECDDNKTMSKCFTEMVRVASWLRLIVTSRPIQEISDELHNLEELIMSRDLFKADAYNDILSFIRAQFSSDGPLKEIRVRVSEDQMQGLAQKARGLFIWIATVLKYVSGLLANKPRAIHDILSLAPASNPEGELDALYLRVLEMVSGSSLDNRKTVRMIVGLIFVTSKNRSLPTSALYAFLSSVIEIELEEADGVLRKLGSVVTADSRTNAIRVCHPSFLDFIGSQTRSKDFWTETVELDAIVARKCFRLMETGLKFNICGLESSYRLNKDVHDLEERVDHCISQELRYSCLYWLNHLSASELGIPGETMLHDFLHETTSLYWLEAMSLICELKTADTILQMLLNSYKGLKQNADLLSAASDLYRFVKAFHQPMSTSTPHIYISAMLWAPSETMIIKLLGPNFNHRQCVLQGRNKFWPVHVQTLVSSSAVCCVAYSPDGTRIVSGCADQMIRIWDTRSGTQVGEPLQGHTSRVSSIVYSPDGSRIISGSHDHTIRIWDVQSATQIGESLQGHNGFIMSVACSPDGTRIVSGSADHTIRIWDVQSGTQIGKPLHGHSKVVWSVAYSPNGTRIVSGSDDGTMQIWDAHSGTQLGAGLQCDSDSVSVMSVAYSPNGTRIVSGHDDGTMQIWDAKSGTQVGEPLQGHSSWVSSIAYSPDGSRIVSSSEDRTIRIWDAQNGTQVSEPLRGHSGTVWSVAYSSDGTHVVSGSQDQTIRIWHVQSSTQVGESLQSHTNSVKVVAYSPDGNRIVCGCVTIQFWDAHSGSQVGEPLQGHSSWVSSIAYSPDGSRLVSGSEDHTIRIWDTQSGTQVGDSLQGHSDSVSSVAYSPDGTCIVSGSEDNTIRIWDVQSGTQVGEPLHGHSDAIWSVAYSPSGTRIVSASKDRTMRIWDVQSRTQVGKPLQSLSSVMVVAYSPDGNRIVSGSDTIQFWDAHSGTLVGEALQGHRDWVYCVAYSPDGTRIVSGSGDDTIRIWDAQSGIQIGEPLQGHSSWVSSIAYSPDGSRIISGSHDHTIRIWDVQSGTQVGESLHGHSGTVWSVAYSPDGSHMVSRSDDMTIRIWDAESDTLIGEVPLGQSRWDASSPDGKYFVWNVSSLGNRAIDNVPEVQSMVYSELPLSVPDDGWIRTLDGGLLLWIPPEYRNGVRDMSLACIPHNADGHRVRIDWNRLPRGSEWTAVKVDR